MQPVAKRRAKAGDEARTRDIFLGKEVLYQLSYTRNYFRGFTATTERRPTNRLRDLSLSESESCARGAANQVVFA